MDTSRCVIMRDVCVLTFIMWCFLNAELTDKQRSVMSKLALKTMSNNYIGSTHLFLLTIFRNFCVQSEQIFSFVNNFLRWNNLVSLVTVINFIDLLECHLLAYYRTRNIKINNNNENLGQTDLIILFKTFRPTSLFLSRINLCNARKTSYFD